MGSRLADLTNGTETLDLFAEGNEIHNSFEALADTALGVEARHDHYLAAVGCCLGEGGDVVEELTLVNTDYVEALP